MFCLCASLVPMVSAEEPTLQNSVDLDQLVEHGIALCRALAFPSRIVMSDGRS